MEYHMEHMEEYKAKNRWALGENTVFAFDLADDGKKLYIDMIPDHTYHPHVWLVGLSKDPSKNFHRFITYNEKLAICGMSQAILQYLPKAGYLAINHMIRKSVPVPTAGLMFAVLLSGLRR